MRDSVALARYLQRHIQPDLPTEHFGRGRWQHVLVIPAYRESSDLLDTLHYLPEGTGRTLVILVINRPDSDPDARANRTLREALQVQLSPTTTTPLTELNTHSDLYVYDMDELYGPNPAQLGVGLARKAGCDLALQWMTEGFINSEWICSTDADATLPDDYFSALADTPSGAVAAVFPFKHVPGDDLACNSATALYELRLRYYVAGLSWAGSHYAHHSLGSCLAVRPGAYAMVRGFPKRAAGEDFYLLNKLAKLGPVSQLQGNPVRLQSRRSSRVPFGTGPMVATIATAPTPADSAIFDHPASFEALRGLLGALPQLAQTPKQSIADLLIEQGLDTALAMRAETALDALGVEASLDHCIRQGRSEAQFIRQFNQWFDALRTLQFLHAIRDAGWALQTLAQLEALQPVFWAGQNNNTTETLADQ
jgi:hypothetical protein